MTALSARASALGLEAIIVARGGGSREDLAVFDSELVARAVASCPVPVVSGIGHEDDTTIVDLVADYRAATPTAAMVALLPDRRSAQLTVHRIRVQLRDVLRWRLEAERRQLSQGLQRLTELHPRQLLQLQRRVLNHQRQLLTVLSPQHWLQRGFSLVRNREGRLISSVQQVSSGDRLTLQLADGELQTVVDDTSRC
ncbi:MAG: hypothetical protein FJ077_14385 [Cyanobacteria bacterium K_DeepCast_35m_m2_023]|nr:hypothetical protein [Cyanobacteria bacterium K_DeepCast_35m_m2_023]